MAAAGAAAAKARMARMAGKLHLRSARADARPWVLAGQGPPSRLREQEVEEGAEDEDTRLVFFPKRGGAGRGRDAFELQQEQTDQSALSKMLSAQMEEQAEIRRRHELRFPAEDQERQFCLIEGEPRSIEKCKGEGFNILRVLVIVAVAALAVMPALLVFGALDKTKLLSGSKDDNAELTEDKDGWTSWQCAVDLPQSAGGSSGGGSIGTLGRQQLRHWNPRTWCSNRNRVSDEEIVEEYRLAALGSPCGRCWCCKRSWAATMTNTTTVTNTTTTETTSTSLATSSTSIDTTTTDTTTTTVTSSTSTDTTTTTASRNVTDQVWSALADLPPPPPPPVLPPAVLPPPPPTTTSSMISTWTATETTTSTSRATRKAEREDALRKWYKRNNVIRTLKDINGKAHPQRLQPQASSSMNPTWTATETTTSTSRATSSMTSTWTAAETTISTSKTTSSMTSTWTETETTTSTSRATSSMTTTWTATETTTSSSTALSEGQQMPALLSSEEATQTALAARQREVIFWALAARQKDLKNGLLQRRPRAQ